MNASDIMSSPVVVVGPQTPVVEIASLLRERRFGGVPVVSGDEIVGIVTEKDLLHRQELGTERRSHTQAWWRRVVGSTSEPDWYVKSHGRCAVHVMTRDVIVVEPRTSLQDITAVFDRKRIGRVPVVKDHRMVGIVACADLVRALAQGSRQEAPDRADTSNATIRAALAAELAAQDWWTAGLCEVQVAAGVVRFTGYFENESQRQASQVAAENVPGVQHVIDDRRPIAELSVML
ncbi:MAG TPA: CBS domain-containing protein [Ramlibacter sp.]|uniref:CBS domain-containing protein n=1 Tax=Ramlibacter sp. TaxID=1917967 RepID=UPI002ED31E7B